MVLFFNGTATTEIYTLAHTTLFRSAASVATWRRCCRVGSGTRFHSDSYDSGSTIRTGAKPASGRRPEEHTSELQSRQHLVCRFLLEKYYRHPSSLSVISVQFRPCRY